MTDPTQAQTRASLEPIFSPRSVAVVGASRNRDSIGFALLHNLVMGQFQGAIYPINPHASSIHSLKAYPRIAEVPDELLTPRATWSDQLRSRSPPSRTNRPMPIAGIGASPKPMRDGYRTRTNRARPPTVLHAR